MQIFGKSLYSFSLLKSNVLYIKTRVKIKIGILRKIGKDLMLRKINGVKNKIEIIFSLFEKFKFLGFIFFLFDINIVKMTKKIRIIKSVPTDT